jgi:hypothetical protein
MLRRCCNRAFEAENDQRDESRHRYFPKIIKVHSRSVVNTVLEQKHAQTMSIMNGSINSSFCCYKRRHQSSPLCEKIESRVIAPKRGRKDSTRTAREETGLFRVFAKTKPNL